MSIRINNNQAGTQLQTATTQKTLNTTNKLALANQSGATLEIKGTLSKKIEGYGSQGTLNETKINQMVDKLKRVVDDRITQNQNVSAQQNAGVCDTDCFVASSICTTDCLVASNVCPTSCVALSEGTCPSSCITVSCIQLSTATAASTNNNSTASQILSASNSISMADLSVTNLSVRTGLTADLSVANLSARNGVVTTDTTVLESIQNLKR